ncbi:MULTISPECIES: FAD-dependent monooxygenase [unclassified Leptolyngbya]|uniref:FAD-dependent monooxygenase n=1 Tax=unclassified Leptolyngbya TaxID=2650499 RepID=UPI001683DB02|nr:MULTISPECIES: FAD-dependent monooxygenase [unclassified Leptolyngbya]MBD1909081.1 FAD-dependent monooxygenase [Leptolyngbya sp. FACHB-8]MBD2157008.1 FAD-dependent monooxygenase [Leptolyngbya sp. FACHB-16]
MNVGSNTIDVLVVGAGPVGLAMACELLRRGVACRIIDKAAAPVQTSRALGIQARTLEVFEAMGVIDAALAAGTQARGVTFHRGDEDILYISLQHIREKESPYPFLLILPQSQTELILNQQLQELGGTVERSRELMNIRQEEDWAIAQIKPSEADTNDIEEIQAKWLIGCDGASSQVRKILAMPFEGTTAPEEWLLADVDLDWQRTRETTHGWFTKDGVFAVFPLPTGQWRLFAPAGKRTSEVSVEVFQNLLRQYTDDTQTTVSHPTWMSKFKVNYRMVDNYRQGHVLVAGDAAHIHSPFGGQGMNIGIQDAYNLAWKLALVIQEKARDSLLDTYQEERSPVARFILRGTQTATQGVLVTQNPGLRWVRDRVLVPLLRLNILQRKLAQEASELNVNYRRSSLSVSTLDPGADLRTRIAWWKAPHAGDRALPGPCLHYPTRDPITLFQAFRGTESHLLLFAGLTQPNYTHLANLASNVENEMGSIVKAHIVVPGTDKPTELPWEGSLLLDPEGTLHTLYGVHKPSLYFIRPDGHIAFRSQPIDEKAFLHYLNQLFLLQTPA